MTKSELRDLVRSNTNRQDKDSVADSALSLGLEKSAMMHDFQSMRIQSDVRVSANEISVALPDDLWKLREARVINIQNTQLVSILELRDQQWILERFESPSTMIGRPTFGYIQNRSLYIVPKAQESYDLRMSYTRLPTLVSDTDSVEITGLDEALVAYATAFVFRSVQLFQDAQTWMTEFYRALDSAIQHDRRQPMKKVQMDPHPGTDAAMGFVGDPSRDPFLAMRLHNGEYR